MGFGSLLLRSFGMKKRYQGLFEKFLKIGIMGLGYGQPMRSVNLEEALLKRILSKVEKPVIFDVGANKGQYLDLIHRALPARNFVVHAFEPDRKNVELLTNTYANGNINIIPFGLGVKNEKLRFYKYEQDDLSSMYHSQDQPGGYRNNMVTDVVEIDLTTIDDYCRERAISAIDFLKIDTEGHDYFVLKGAEKLIGQNRIRNIQFEFSEMNLVSRTTFFDFWGLLHKNYDIYRICRDGNFLISEYQPLLHEIYYPVNFFASLKTSE